MGVLVITPDGLDSVQELMASLQAQTVAADLELVVVSPRSIGTLDLASAAATFACTQHVVIDEYDPIAAWSAGARAAASPVVVLTEEHCLPEPEWAEHLLQAYGSEPMPVAAGPMLRNANPASVNSWANFLLEYGEWCVPTDAGDRRHLPGHNSSYRRAFLVERPDLERDLMAETLMHWDAADEDSRFVYAPEARAAHLNHEKTFPSLALRFKSGRVFAGLRAASWSLGRKLAFALATPAVICVRMYRLVPVVRAVEPSPPRRSYLALAMFTLASSLGEAVGTLIGPGEVRRWLADVEVGRARFLRT